MTRVDFYLLKDSSASTRLELACKLAEKASARSQQVFVYSTERHVLQELDERLWDFRPASFVAHQLLPENHISSLADNDPVLLSSSEPGNKCQLLINLDKTVPPFFSRFERTLEIVNKEPDIEESGRVRYRFYQERGYPLTHHNL